MIQFSKIFYKKIDLSRKLKNEKNLILLNDKSKIQVPNDIQGKISL